MTCRIHLKRVIRDETVIRACVPERVAPTPIELAGGAVGTSTVSGGLTLSRALSGSAVGTSSVSGRLDARMGLSGAAVGTATVSGALSVIRQPYAEIVDLQPDFFVQFVHPVWYGEQVLFRDPECTSPVTDPGNHTIGGVRDPFTGDIVLTQESASRRPLWTGDSAGFDGVDDYFGSDFDGLGDEFSQFISGENVVYIGEGHAFLLEGGSKEREFSLWVRPGGSLDAVVNTRDQSNSIVSATTGGPIGFDSFVLGAKVFQDYTCSIISPDGVEHTTDTSAKYFAMATRKLLVGSQTGSDRFNKFDCRWMAAFNRITTPAEEAMLRANP